MSNSCSSVKNRLQQMFVWNVIRLIILPWWKLVLPNFRINAIFLPLNNICTLPCQIWADQLLNYQLNQENFYSIIRMRQYDQLVCLPRSVVPWWTKQQFYSLITYIFLCEMSVCNNPWGNKTYAQLITEIIYHLL